MKRGVRERIVGSALDKLEHHFIMHDMEERDKVFFLRVADTFITEACLDSYDEATNDVFAIMDRMAKKPDSAKWHTKKVYTK